MKPDDVRDAIRAGNRTASDIAEYLGVSRSHASRELKRFVAIYDDLERHDAPEGNGYVYRLTASDEESADDLPVVGDREYDWATMVPDPDENEYREADTELTEIEAVIDERRATGQLARVRLKGPPGTGKTTLAQWIAAKRGWPYVELQLTASMREPDLYGSPKLIGGETMWSDGPITKALLCSQERPVVLVLDEINRATPKSKTALMSALDHRARVTLQARGNEVIQGDATNLIVVSTMNYGSEFATFDLDPAEKRRLGPVWQIPHMGMVDLSREAKLVADEAPVGIDTARTLVDAANGVRRAADSDQVRTVESGIAVSDVIVWAQTARAYADQGIDAAVVRAADATIVRRQYDDEDAQQEVRSRIRDVVEGRVRLDEETSDRRAVG